MALVNTGHPFLWRGLKSLGIETDKMGRIQVDDHFATAIPSVFAIGDAIDGPMLAHKAEEGIACVENIAGFAGHVNHDVIPGVIYATEMATVGLTEVQIKESGMAYNKGVFPFSANSRARAIDYDGQVKILKDKETDKIQACTSSAPTPVK